MAEFIEREKAFDAVFGQFCASSDETEAALNAAIEEIRAIPAADVRPVVFCKDCRHRDPEDHKCDCGQPERQGCIFSVRDNYWCACGEKREE